MLVVVFVIISGKWGRNEKLVPTTTRNQRKQGQSFPITVGPMPWPRIPEAIFASGKSES